MFAGCIGGAQSPPHILRNVGGCNGILANRFRESDLEELKSSLPWLFKEELTGYAFRQAFSESDAAYTASMSVAKATDSGVHGIDGYKPKFRFAFPVIIVDSPLVRCSLKENGSLHLEEIESGEFLFRANLPRHFGTCVRVVTIEALPRFVAEAKQLAKQLRAEFKSEVDLALEKM